MKLKNFIKYLDPLQDIQLINAKTGEVLTSVNYLDDSLFYENQVSSYKEDYVYGIASSISNEDTSFLIITITNQIR